MREYQSLSHTRWDCKYHVVFIPNDSAAIFATACFGHPSPSNRQKLNATNHCLRRPSRSLRLGSGQALLLSFYTQQGV